MNRLRLSRIPHGAEIRAAVLNDAIESEPDTMITASDLIGTWRFSRPGEGTGEAFLHFTYTRAYDFIYEGEIRQPLKLYYSIEPPDMIRFRTHPEDEGWTCRLEFDGAVLTIHAEDSRTVCSRPPVTEIPAWFQQELAAYMARA